MCLPFAVWIFFWCQDGSCSRHFSSKVMAKNSIIICYNFAHLFAIAAITIQHFNGEIAGVLGSVFVERSYERSSTIQPPILKNNITSWLLEDIPNCNLQIKNIHSEILGGIFCQFIHQRSTSRFFYFNCLGIESAFVLELETWLLNYVRDSENIYEDDVMIKRMAQWRNQSLFCLGFWVMFGLAIHSIYP